MPVNVSQLIDQVKPEFVFTASRSSGPGGQNVNKVNSRITLSWRVSESSLAPEVKEMILKKLHSRITADGELQITVQENRSQLQNKEATIQKLHELLSKAFAPRKVRKPTKPGKAAKQARLQTKKQHSEKKKWRQKPE
ncbi:MAG: aminoacyl-tRNA hydrolase [Cyclobacteriaceae bacterium]|nr:MAG: aminoacyl-tRNA hydrolase [Cyclobacteriaceae bacterium]